MKTDHTPGPWYTRHGMISSLHSTHGATIATVNTTSKHIPDREAKANCCLIAAATDLLKELDSAEFTLSAMMAGDEELQAQVSRIRTVIYDATHPTTP